MYNLPLLYYIDKYSAYKVIDFDYSYKNLKNTFELKLDIIEIPLIVHNESIDGALKSDYWGYKYQLELEVQAIPENSLLWQMLYDLSIHLNEGGKVNIQPHKPGAGLPYNYYSEYIDCLAKEPRHENIRYQKLHSRWSFRYVFQTKDVL